MTSDLYNWLVSVPTLKATTFIKNVKVFEITSLCSEISTRFGCKWLDLDHVQMDMGSVKPGINFEYIIL